MNVHFSNSIKNREIYFTPYTESLSQEDSRWLYLQINCSIYTEQQLLLFFCIVTNHLISDTIS